MIRRATFLPLIAVVVGSSLAVASVRVVEAAGQDQASSKELELKACGPKEKEVNYSADTDKKNHPTPDPPRNAGLVYVLRPTMLGNKIQSKVAADGEWKGVNRGNNYFSFTLPPGQHHLCSQAENRSVLTLKVEAGKTYFLQQHIEMGLLKARNRLDVMSDEEGRKKLKDMNLATWKVK